MNYYMGQGKMYAALRGNNGKPGDFFLLGNCTRFDLMLGKGVGRFIKSARRPLARQAGTTPTVAIDLEDFQPRNMALLMHGEAVTTNGGTSISTTVTPKRSVITALPHINIRVVFSVTKVSDGSFLPASDYILNKGTGSIQLTANSTVADGTPLAVFYEHDGYATIGAATNKQPYLALRFEGVNNARDNSGSLVEVYKTKFDPVDSLSFIGDNFGSMSIGGKVYYDETVLADARPEGRFFRVRQLKPE